MNFTSTQNTKQSQNKKRSQYTAEQFTFSECWMQQQQLSYSALLGKSNKHVDAYLPTAVPHMGLENSWNRIRNFHKSYNFTRFSFSNFPDFWLLKVWVKNREMVLGKNKNSKLFWFLYVYETTKNLKVKLG